MFRRILLWFGGMLVFSFAAFILTTWLTAIRPPGRKPMMRRLFAYQFQEAIRVWEQGGAESLRPFLQRLDAGFPARHHLTDSGRRDLADGQDRSNALRRASDTPAFRIARPLNVLMKRVSPDGRYAFLTENEFQPPDPWANIAVYGWIVLIIVLLCYALAWTLARPIRRLRETVARFGAGDLHTHTRSKRRDELGDLERSFDQMADRIETLLNAERRLLQDISHELRSPLARLRFALELAHGAPMQSRTFLGYTRKWSA